MFQLGHKSLIERLREQDIVGHVGILSYTFAYFLNLADFRVARIDGYGMATQESRNNSQILLLHLEMYRPCNNI